MEKGLLFWIIWVLCFLFGGAWYWAPDRLGRVGSWGGGILVLIMLFILGWHNFGFVIR